MSSTLRHLIRERKLLRIVPKREMVLKEIEGAQSDLRDAQDSLAHKKFKWATIQGYYSMFHSARALLYHKGFREKSHYALSLAIRELFVNELGRNLINQFEDGMELRQEADYGLKFSEAGATETVEGAERFLKRAKEILMIK